MKQFKKLFACVIAFAMVLGMVGVMPAVEAKAAMTAAVVKPVVGTGITKIEVGLTFADSRAIDPEITNDDLKNAFSAAKVVAGDVATVEDNTEGTAITMNSASYADGVITIVTSGYEVQAGQKVAVKIEADSLYDNGGRNGDVVDAGWIASDAATVVVPPQEQTPAGAVSALAFNSATNELTVTVTGGEENDVVYVQIGERKNEKVKAYSAYEVVLDDTGSTKINISAYAKKEVELSVHTGVESAAQLIKIKKNDTKLKVTLNLDEADVLNRFEVKNGTAALTAGTVVQYRLDGEAWKTFDASGKTTLEADIAKIEQFGTTIYFRALGKDGLIGTEGTFATAEAKVKYPKLGKQPAVTVDYVKNVVKFPKNVEIKYILPGAGTETVGSVDKTKWQKFAATKEKAGTVEIDKLLAKGSVEKAFTFYVRTAALDKKPNSAIAAVDIYAATVNDMTVSNTSVKIEPVYKSATDKTVKGIKITNMTGKEISYRLSGTETWVKLANNGYKIISGTASELSAKKLTVKYNGTKGAPKASPAVLPIRQSATEELGISVSDPVEASATVGDATVAGTADSPITAVEVTITLVGDKFKAIAANASVAGWFTGLPSALTATVKTAVADNAAAVTVTIEGTSAAEKSGAIAIKIPAASLVGAEDITVTTNPNAKYAIAPKAVTP